jgi:hypothetical protein
MHEAPHNEAGYYLCPCGADKYGQPYNRRSIFHAHGTLRPVMADEFRRAVEDVLSKARLQHQQLSGRPVRDPSWAAPHPPGEHPIEVLRKRVEALKALRDMPAWHNKKRTWADVLKCLIGKHTAAQSGIVGGVLVTRCSCSAFYQGRRLGWVQLDGWWHGPRDGWTEDGKEPI